MDVAPMLQSGGATRGRLSRTVDFWCDFSELNVVAEGGKAVSAIGVIKVRRIRKEPSDITRCFGAGQGQSASRRWPPIIGLTPSPLSRFLSKFRQLTVGTPATPFSETPTSRNRGAPAATDGKVSDRGRRHPWELEADIRGMSLVVVTGRSKLVLFGPEVRVRTRDPGSPKSPDPATTHVLGNGHFVESYFASRTDLGTRTMRPKSSKTGGESFLSSCYTCKKIIEPTADIYIYRGENAFCSWDCRHREILQDKYVESL